MLYLNIFFSNLVRLANELFAFLEEKMCDTKIMNSLFGFFSLSFISYQS